MYYSLRCGNDITKCSVYNQGFCIYDLYFTDNGSTNSTKQPK